MSVRNQLQHEDDIGILFNDLNLILNLYFNLLNGASISWAIYICNCLIYGI